MIAGIEAFFGRQSNGAALVLFLAGHVGVLVAFALATRGVGPLHHDMTEAFAWGQEFQLGYHKHPPLFAWVAGAWFQVMPRTDWSFYLLSAVNSGLALAGVWALAGRWLDRPTRWVALLLLWLTPFFTIHAITFNANAALLASWAWTACFVARSLDHRGLRDGMFAGVCAALAILTKYFSVVLLAGCLLAILAHPNVRAYFRSPAPYAAVIAGLAVLAPHLHWLLAGDGATLLYALQKTAFPSGDVRWRALGTLAGAAGSLTLAGLVFALAFRGHAGAILHAAGRAAVARSTLWIAVLAFAPLVLAFALVPAANVRITSPFLIPALFMATIAPLALARVAADAPAVRVAARAVAALACLMLLGGAVVRAAPSLQDCPAPDEVRRQAARFGSALWRAKFARPLAFVGGDDVYAKAATFYATDAPSLVALDAPATTPWASPQAWQRAGLLLICPDDCRQMLGADDRARALVQTEIFDRGPRCRGPATAAVPVTFVLLPPRTN